MLAASETTSRRSALAPFPNELGQRISAEVCEECWEAWKHHQMLLINHYGLNLQDSNARTFLITNLKSFLFAEGPAGASIDTSKEGRRILVGSRYPHHEVDQSVRHVDHLANRRPFDVPTSRSRPGGPPPVQRPGSHPARPGRWPEAYRSPEPVDRPRPPRAWQGRTRASSRWSKRLGSPSGALPTVPRRCAVPSVRA